MQEGLARLGAPATPELAGALLRYLALLQQWNRAYNLTSITALDDMVVRHLFDSIAARPFIAGRTVLDAATGAGLPGIPLALADPGRRFTLVDSVGKKVLFLQQAVAELGLPNVTPVQVRLERWQPPAPFDTIICRAFASLAQFVAACAAHVAPGGRLVAMKGRYPHAELAGVPAPWRVTAVTPVAVPGLDAERHIVVMEC